jgi:hypothetical protein
VSLSFCLRLVLDKFDCVYVDSLKRRELSRVSLAFTPHEKQISGAHGPVRRLTKLTQLDSTRLEDHFLPLLEPIR